MDYLKWSANWILGDTVARNGYLFDINKELGCSRSPVYECKRMSDGMALAIKRISWTGLTNKYNEIIREKQLWQNLNHPNIVQLVDFFADNHVYNGVQYFYQVMEKCRCDLDQWFLENPNRGPEMCKAMIGQIIVGLSYLHDQQLMHRDLKPANVLIGEDGVCKIADFDFTVDHSVTIKGAHTVKVGTALYGSPEQFSPDIDGAYNLKVDIYPLAIYELRSGRIPIKFCEDFNKELNNQFYNDLHNLVTKMTRTNYNERPALNELHNYLK